MNKNMEKHKDLISVIVPVYNVEKYLDRCVESIVNQTYRNLEIILVDDGSPDNCPVICDKWAERDCRVKVIHKQNGGLSDARNAGMEIATGELIGFVDSDDWIEPEMYQLLRDYMIEHDCDISACGVQMDWENCMPSKRLTVEGYCILNTIEAMKASIEETWLKQPVWYKLYKTKLVKDILFPVGKYHEDVFWSYQAIGRADKIGIFDRPCYHYLQRSGSIMGEGYSLKRLDSLEAKLARVQYIKNRMPELTNIAKIDLCFSCIYATQMLMKYCSEEVREIGLKRIKNVLKKNSIRLKDIKPGEISLKQFIWFTLSKISFMRTCGIRNKLGKGF